MLMTRIMLESVDQRTGRCLALWVRQVRFGAQGALGAGALRALGAGALGALDAGALGARVCASRTLR